MNFCTSKNGTKIIFLDFYESYCLQPLFIICTYIIHTCLRRNAFTLCTCVFSIQSSSTFCSAHLTTHKQRLAYSLCNSPCLALHETFYVIKALQLLINHNSYYKSYTATQVLDTCPNMVSLPLTKMPVILENNFI